MSVPRPGESAYEAAMRIAEGEDAEERLKLASSDEVAPEILYFLAEDEDPRVRLAVARLRARAGLAQGSAEVAPTGLSARAQDTFPGNFS